MPPDVREIPVKPGGNLEERWTRFVEQLVHDRPSVGFHLSAAYVASWTEDALDLRFPAANQFQYNEVLKKKNRDEIQKKLNEVTQRSISLRISLEPQGQAGGQKPAAASRSSPSINDDIGREPIIKSVLDIFDGAVM